MTFSENVIPGTKVVSNEWTNENLLKSEKILFLDAARQKSPHQAVNWGILDLLVSSWHVAE